MLGFFASSFLAATVFCLSISMAETLWFWDFTEEPSGWSHDEHWDYTADGAVLYINDPLYPERLDTLTTSLQSEDLILPVSVENKNLMISFTHALTYMGIVWDQAMWTDIEVRVNINSSTFYPYTYNEYTNGVYAWYDTLSTESCGEIYFILSQVDPDDVLSFEFYFHTGFCSIINSTFIDWTITNLKVEAVDTAIAKTTWGWIKHSF